MPAPSTAVATLYSEGSYIAGGSGLEARLTDWAKTSERERARGKSPVTALLYVGDTAVFIVIDQQTRSSICVEAYHTRRTQIILFESTFFL